MLFGPVRRGWPWVSTICPAILSLLLAVKQADDVDYVCASWRANARAPIRGVHAGRRSAEGAARWRACVLRSVGERRRDDPE
eukprot:2182162-Pleurochrysis_carterae.AAC.1